MTSERFILLPGMGTDERLFGPQREGGLEFEVPVLPMPSRSDTMRSYAERLRDQLRIDGPCILGGTSFGGMLAVELASLVPARCVLLVASCRSCKAIPRFYYFLELWTRLLPAFLIRSRGVVSSRIIAKIENLSPAHYQLLREMSRSIPVPMLRRVARMILRWDCPTQPPCPVFHIHGARDTIIPLRMVQADEVIPDGGHLISLTHADQVNRFLRQHLEQFAAPAQPAPVSD